MEVRLLGGRLTLDDRLLGAAGTDPATVREAVRREVTAYERGERLTFDVPVAFPDSFTGRVMRVMCDIPPGETRTYGELAAVLDTAPVAVGGACGRNPVPLVVPCHRVVASDDIGGYSGAGGVAFKRRLLDHEARVGGAGA